MNNKIKTTPITEGHRTWLLHEITADDGYKSWKLAEVPEFDALEAEGDDQDAPAHRRQAANRRASLYLHNGWIDGTPTQAVVNWSACGDQDARTAKEFAEAIRAAAEAASRINAIIAKEEDR